EAAGPTRRRAGGKLVILEAAQPDPVARYMPAGHSFQFNRLIFSTKKVDFMTEYRIEHDTMGEVKVPKDALWSAQTQRAVENFPISGRGLESAQIRAMGLLKAACAQVNKDSGALDAE